MASAMAAAMIPSAEAPSFLAAHGWRGARIEPLAGDASFRRYFRVIEDGRSAVLMDAPPEHEDVGPFLKVADHLLRHGFRAPRAIARDRNRGLLLLEDFGDLRVGPLLAHDPGQELQIYESAIDTLVALKALPLPKVDLYDEPALKREVDLFPDWYASALELEVDRGAFDRAWHMAWAATVERALAAPVLVLRDYHADNLMLLDDGSLGLLDFQDALAGHPAYDLVSLLQDARRDVSLKLEQAMVERYIDRAGIADRDAFLSDYQLLGAQRNTKILGIFTRLWKRDGKPHYLPLQARVWGYLERNLAAPSVAPVRAWFDANIPAAARAAAWKDSR